MQMMERDKIIREMITEGIPKDEIFRALSNKFNISPRTVETQYYKIVNDVTELLTEHRAEIAMTTLARQHHIYNVCMKKGKEKTALDATIWIARLAKLYDKQEIEPKKPEINIVEADFSKPLTAVNDDGD